MKILHTADWHLGESLGPHDRRDDIRRALQRIAGYLEEHQVEVMLVAGDVFCERSRHEQLRRAVADIREIFLPFLERGGTIVAVSGNHDNETFFETLRDALDLAAPGRPDPDGHHATGRLYVAARPRVLRLASTVGNAVQFVLMPYPTARYLRGPDVERVKTVEDKHRVIRERFLGTLETVKQRELDPRLPSVLVSHVHVRGAPPQSRSLFRITETEDVVLDPADLPLHWAYSAYGHIHKPQTALAGADHARYAGSIERMNQGEAGDQKSVVLFEISGAGLVGSPALLDLESTPIYEVEIADPDAEIPQLRQRYPDAAEALVRYILHYDPARHNRDALCAAVHQVFPRWHDRTLIDVKRGPLGSSTSLSTHDLDDVPSTVRGFLAGQLEGHADRDALLVLAEELLADSAPGQASDRLPEAIP